MRRRLRSTLDAILPGQLLAVLATSRPIADRYLVWPDSGAEHLARHLGFHPETGRPDVELAVQLQRHQLETGLEVTDVAVEQDVRDGRHAAIAQHVQVGIGVVAAERPG